MKQKKSHHLCILLVFFFCLNSFQATSSPTPHAIKGCIYINGTIAPVNTQIKLIFPDETLSAQTFPLDDCYNYNIGFYNHEQQTCTFQIYYDNSWHIPTNNPTIMIKKEQTIYHQDLYLGHIPKANLHSMGSFHRSMVLPGQRLHGHFWIENNGDPLSTLHWEITNWPTYGTWTFQYATGMDSITSVDGRIRIDINVKMPFRNIIHCFFHPIKTGEITIKNIDNPTNEETISVNITMFFPQCKNSALT